MMMMMMISLSTSLIKASDKLDFGIHFPPYFFKYNHVDGIHVFVVSNLMRTETTNIGSTLMNLLIKWSLGIMYEILTSTSNQYKHLRKMRTDHIRAGPGV